jgi:pimeloyl-ACP methyl ester carboxylesterase
MTPINVTEPMPDGSPRPSPIIICIHGAWHGAWCWEEHFLPHFAERGYQALAVDLPGHGAARHDGTDLKHATLETYVAPVLELVRAQLDPVVLIGHSMGAQVARLVQERLYSAEQRELTALVWLANAEARVAGLRALWPLLRRHPAVAMRLAVTRDVGALVRSPKLVRSLLFRPQTPARIVDDCFTRVGPESAAVMGDLTHLAKRPRVAPQAPVLVLHATQDAFVTRALSQATAADFSRATSEVEYAEVPGGHDVMLDADWEVAARRISRWLEGLPAAAEAHATADAIDRSPLAATHAAAAPQAGFREAQEEARP